MSKKNDPGWDLLVQTLGRQTIRLANISLEMKITPEAAGENFSYTLFFNGRRIRGGGSLPVKAFEEPTPVPLYLMLEDAFRGIETAVSTSFPEIEEYFKIFDEILAEARLDEDIEDA